MSKFRATRATAAFVAAALLLAACDGGSNSGSNGGGGPGGGGTLRMGAAYGVDSLNPFVGINSLDSMTYRVVYPFLLQYNNVGSVVTDWARSYTVSPDGRTWSFTTPSGSKWSDGRPLTASDAAWTISTLLKDQKQAAAAFASYLSNITRAVATSPTTLVVSFSRPTSTGAYGLANIPILPKHIWAHYASGNGAGLLHFPNTSPVGAGPFLVSKYAYKQSIVFSRNPTYWGIAPKLAGFGIVAYSNIDALVTALQTNALDVILEAPATAIKTLKANPSIRLETASNYDVSEFWINSNAHRPTDPELRNPTVREALMLAINRQQMNNVINLGYGSIGPSILGPNHPNVDRSLPPPTYDPAQANHLLDGLGFKRGPGGIRVADGHPMSYVLRASNVTTGYPQNANMIVADLKQVGISVNVITTDYNAYLAAIHANKYTNFDFALDDNNPTYDPSQFMSTMTCGQIGSENDGAYCNPAYDKLYNQQLSEVGAARQKTLDAMQQIIYRDKPLIPLFWAPNVFALRDTVHGFPPTPLPTINYESTQWLNGVTVN